MALNIKNPVVERLAAEVARLTGDTKTEAIRKALQERKRQLKKPFADQRRHVVEFLERKVWQTIPKKHLGRRLTRAEEDQILGYGPEGV
jgi:antitoxin VapB